MRITLFLALLLLSVVMVQAKEPITPAGFLRSPEALFSDTVELVAVGTDDYYAPENSPYLIYGDWENQRFVRVNRDNWQVTTLPYPEETHYSFVLDSTSHVLQQGNLLYVDIFNHPHEVWTLNIDTMAFERYTPACPEHELTLDILAESWRTGWMFVYFNGIERWGICDAQTGELIQAMPDLDIISISPDAKWLLTYGDIERDWRERHNLYGYEIATGEQHFLGNIDNEALPADSYYQVWRWFGHVALLPVRDMPEWTTEWVYRVNVDVPDSLKVATTRYRYRATDAYLDNPPRFDFTVGMEGDFRGTCTRVIYDILSDTTTEDDLGLLCHPEAGNVDRVGYYRQVDDLDNRHSAATLIRWDRATNERNVLYGPAEIEAVLWISPDEHFAALLIDLSGSVDMLPYLTPGDPIAPQYPYTVLVDLVRGKELYNRTSPYYFADLYETMTQIAPDRFIVMGTGGSENRARLLELDAHYRVRSSPLMNHALFVMPTGKIIYQEGDMLMMAAPRETGVPLMHTAGLDEFHAQNFHVDADGLLNIEVWDSHLKVSMNYVLRLK